MTDKYRSRIRDAHAEQTDALIRLRLVAPADVVQAAEGLHQADHRVWESALGLTSESSDWQLLRDLQATAREELLRISRRRLGLSPAAPLQHSSSELHRGR